MPVIQRQYKSAADHYDSLDVAEPALQLDSIEVIERKESLRKIANMPLMKNLEMI
jgi:hypothetical protein